MPIPFADYLTAKYTLDSRSLNPDIYQCLVSELKAKTQLRWLDMGTGSAAMLRRLVNAIAIESIDAIGIDNNPALLELGESTTERWLSDQGYSIKHQDGALLAQLGEKYLQLRFDCRSVLDAIPQNHRSNFNLVTAHAFMDLVPPAPITDSIANYLSAGGLFYGTLNYDGETALIPEYRDENFENKLLANYDQSMEIRRLNGAKTGGAKSARRLLSVLENKGFKVIAYGSSDWNITPIRGRYRDSDQTCIAALLEMINKEATRKPEIDFERLDAWYADRLSRVEKHQLGMIIHQLDILAAKI